MLQTGNIFANRYEIISLVGSGGMADVYKAKCHRLNRYVAIKVLKKEFGSDAEFVKRFHTEAQAAAALMHPNIVSVYDVGEADGLHYIVMELVEGITLKEYIHQKGCLSANENIIIATQIALGIEAAHKNNTVHRDIKPQNIIITDDGRVKVADFGIARATGGNTITPNAMGSVHYFSPEQARGGYVDFRTDIYSLGISMYEMATGHIPFDGDNAVTIALKHIQEEIQFTEKEKENLTPGLEKIILKAVNKKPDFRYATMTEMLADFKQAYDDTQGSVAASSGPVSITDGATQVVKKEDVEKIKEMAGDKKDYSQYAVSETEDVEETEENSLFKNTKEMDPKLEKIIRILCIVVGGIFVVIFIIFLMSQINRFQGAIGNEKTTENTTEQTSTENKDQSQDETVAMPNLVNKTWEEALEILEKNKLEYEVVEEVSNDVEEGFVIRQSIRRGDEVAVGTKVTIVVSIGKDQVEVPKVVGKKADDAEKILKDAEFKVERTEEFSSTVKAGEVISQDPAGDKAPHGSTVKIVVSKGAEPVKQVSVPSVKGHKEAEAKSIIESAGLFLGTIREVSSNQYEAGYVISQTPEAGTSVNAGTKIDIVISTGPAANDPSGDGGGENTNPDGGENTENQTGEVGAN